MSFSDVDSSKPAGAVAFGGDLRANLATIRDAGALLELAFETFNQSPANRRVWGVPSGADPVEGETFYQPQWLDDIALRTVIGLYTATARGLVDAVADPDAILFGNGWRTGVEIAGGYFPLAYTPIGTAAELLDGGAAGSDPMGTRRHYGQDDTIVEVIDTVPEGVEWLAVREGTGLTVRSVVEWGQGQAVTIGDRRWLDDGGTNRVYVAASAGTTGATPPTGVGAGISDGSVTWDYEQDGGPVTFNGQAEVQVLGVGGVAIFTRLGTTAEIAVGGNIGKPAVLPPDVAVAAVRNGSDLELDLGAASVFDYATDATAFSDLVFLNAPAEGAVSALLRLERSGAGAVGFASIDFGDAGAPSLGAASGDDLWVRLTRDAAGGWRGVRIFGAGAPPPIRNQIVESEKLQTPSSSSGALAIGLGAGTEIAATLTEDITTHTLSGVPSTGRRVSITYRIVQGSGPFTMVWPAGFDWGAAGAPALPAGAGDEMVVTAFTDDGGTSWKAMLAWSD